MKMIKSTNYTNAFIGICLILWQVSNGLCLDLSRSVVKIYTDHRYLCAGTLVKDNFVVTTAECLERHRHASVLTVVGNVIRNKDVLADESPVLGIFKPPDYNKTTKYMNVGVLELQNSITGSIIKPSELCSKNSIGHGEALTLYYWDVQNNTQRYLSDTVDLKTSEFSANLDDQCADSYRTKLLDTTFCAAPRHKATHCFSGSGGPAAIDGQFCAIYSYYDACLEGNVPILFTSLANPKISEFIKRSSEKSYDKI